MQPLVTMSGDARPQAPQVRFFYGVLLSGNLVSRVVSYRSKNEGATMAQERLDSIQILRAVAALAVLIGHTYFEVAWFAVGLYHEPTIPLPFALRYGAAGVDLFFVISGFVMVSSSEDLFGKESGSLIFAGRRILRIAPLYWVATTLVILQLWHIGGSLTQEHVSPICTLASYLFVPCERTAGDTLNPILGVGWSLNYEMFFYAIFALCMMLTRRRAVIALVATLLLFASLRDQMPTRTLNYLADSIIIEFAFGAVIGLLYREGFRLSRTLALATLIAGVLAFAIPSFFGVWPFERWADYRPLIWGAPFALILAGAVFAEARSPLGSGWAAAALIGDASYSVYLFHPAVYTAFRTDTFKLASWVVQWPWLYVATLIVLAVGIALGIYFALERPLTRWLYRTLLRGIRIGTQAESRGSSPMPSEQGT
jgi:exopolysaccharide production protein ExoZ